MIVRLALPALGALLVEPLYNLTDSAIVGHLGRSQLAGLALAAGVLNLVWWTTGFLGQVTLTRVAHGVGSGDRQSASRTVAAAYLLALVLGILGSVLVASFAAPATAVLGGKGAVAAYSVRYLRIAALGVTPLMLSLAGTGHQNGLGRTRRTFEIALTANALNVALEVLLVYGAHFGIAGSAWGTVAAQVVAAAGFLVSSLRSTIRPMKPRLADVRRLVADGVPLTVRTLALDAALLASTAVAARLGASSLAAQQVVLQVWILLALAVDCLAVAAQVMIGEATGRGDRSGVMSMGKRLLFMAVVAGSGCGVVTLATANWLPWVFTSNYWVASGATRALYVCGAQQPIAALAFVLDGLLLGAGQYRALSRAMIGALLTFAPAAAVVLIFPQLGIIGVWLALSIWVGYRAASLFRCWRRYLSRLRETTGPALGATVLRG